MPIQRTKTVRRRSLCQLACSGLVRQPLQLLGMITKAAKPHSPNLNPSTILGRSSCRNNFIPSTMSVRPMIDESYCWNDRSSRPITITNNLSWELQTFVEEQALWAPNHALDIPGALILCEISAWHGLINICAKLQKAVP